MNELSDLRLKQLTGRLIALAVCLSFTVPFACAEPPAKHPTPPGSVAKSSGFVPEKQTAISAKGKALFAKRNCSACHSIDGNGGCLAPPLDGIGSRRKEAFMFLRISNEKGFVEAFQKLYGQAELMPHPRIPMDEAKSIVAFLGTLPAPKSGFLVQNHVTGKSQIENRTTEPDEKSLREGRKLYNDFGCSACHSINGLGGNFAPELAGISQRYTSAQIEERISRANLITLNTDEYAGRGAPMPPVNVSESDVRKITDFLMSLKSRVTRAK